MPRPRSDDKRAAILAAATRIIAVQGLGASTAAIATEAGVSNGSLFTYFDTKAQLLNELFLELKSEMATSAGASAPEGGPRERLESTWMGWLGWARTQPEKRRALAQLQVSDEITSATHASAAQVMKGAMAVLEECRVDGPMRDAPASLVLMLANAMAEATIDYQLLDPHDAEDHARAGFDALWRVIG